MSLRPLENQPKKKKKAHTRQHTDEAMRMAKGEAAGDPPGLLLNE